MEDLKISEEMAEKSFYDWCDANYIDEKELTDEATKKIFLETKNAFVKYMKNGRLSVDNDSLSFTLSNRNPDGFKGLVLRIENPGAKLILARDGYNENQQAAKIIAGMSAMTDKDVGVFRKIKDLKDFNFLSFVETLFLVG